MDPQARAPRPLPAQSVFDTPIPRRRMLLIIGAGVIATGSGLGALLEGCAPAAPVTVTLQLTPATMPPGVPVEVPFSLTNSGGAQVQASMWVVKAQDGTLTAFDPRCTHALCKYRWVAAETKFKCNCHGGEYAPDGTVLAGPPPKPLNRFALKATGGVITVDVPADFVAPRESLPA
jgi:Rieske Fe-S protein